jgi:hypothetical protein
MRNSIRLAAVLLGVFSMTQAGLAEAKPAHAVPKADLADVAVGIYQGSVISDSRGSSRSNVTITVVKAGPNQVRVSSSYGRLPPFFVRLTRAMQTIQQASGDNVFLLDLSKSPRGLDVTVDGASWSGSKSGGGEL